MCVCIDEDTDLDPTPGPSALLVPKASQSKKKGNDTNDLNNIGHHHLTSFYFPFPLKGFQFSRQGTNITQKLFQCTKCGKSYSTKSNMKRHFGKECGIDPHSHCSECDFRTYWKRNFQNHLIKMHNVDRSQLATYGAGIIFSCCGDDSLLQNAMPHFACYACYCGILHSL